NFFDGTPNPFHGGPFTITVTITHMGTSPVTVTDPTVIKEAPLVATGGFAFTGLVLSNVVVANFTDTGGPEDPTDPGNYTATINWGDGTTSRGTISLSGTVFSVLVSHTYTRLAATI